MNKNLHLRNAWHEEKKQQQLRDTYGVTAANTIIVERKNAVTNTVRVLLKAAGLCLQVGARIVIAVLAITGLAALAYPGPRELLLELLAQALHQFF